MAAANAARPSPARKSAIPESSDPLSIFVNKLEISRFLTTNYDLEIERWFHDDGYVAALPSSHRPESSQPPLHEYERYSALGGRARDFSLDEQCAVELIDFATNEAPYDLEVAHVHGRATRDSDLVVTERDYQLKYHVDRPAQKIMAEGLQVAFGGNPILFAGFNLSEGDVQRPLKEFVARTSRRNRSLIGFRAAFEDKVSRDAFTMDLYAQYGIHLIHYGFTKEGAAAEDEPATQTPDNSWLYRVTSLIRGRDGSVSDLLRRWAGHDGFATHATQAGLYLQQLKKIAASLKGAGPGGQEWHFISDGGNCDIRLEIQCLEEILAVLSGLDGKRVSSSWRNLLDNALRPALNRLCEGILTAALSAKLHGQAYEWRQWWSHWRKDPHDRAEYVYHRRTGIPGRFGRHVVVEPPDLLSGTGSVLDGLAAIPLPIGSPQRRIVVLTSQRGAGAGAVFARLYKTEEVFGAANAKVRVSGGIKRARKQKKSKKPNYEGRFLANVGFSCEVASVWDALIGFLLCHGEALSVGEKAALAELGRIERLELALRRSRREEGGPRLLVVFTAFDVLFEGGYPKHTEIRRLCDLLLGEAGEQVAMDLVLLVRDANLPLYFRQSAPPTMSGMRLARCLEHRPILGGSRSSAEKARIEALGVALRPLGERNGAISKPSSTRKQGRGDCWIFPVPSPAVDHGMAAKWLKESPIEDMDSFFSDVLQSNRYLLTLVARIAINHKKRMSSWGDEFFIRIRHANTSPSAGVPDRVINEAMTYWSAVEPEWAELDRVIIKHLAVIGIPVGAIVLHQCPEIIEFMERRSDRRAPLVIIERRLNFLEKHTGLLFKIETNPAIGAERPTSAVSLRRPLRRFTVHRLVQRYVYRQLGAQRVEPVDAYFFTVSLYASHTREVPTLSANSYRFIQKLVLRLIHYPTLGLRETDYWHASEGLRAALGVVRTLFSLGIIARFHELVSREAGRPPDMGYFEQHRLAIRWMLMYGRQLEQNWDSQVATWRQDETTAPFARPPFYNDEVMWLYNECGVFSLAQGGSQDAVALFSQAIRMSHKIEGKAGGPMRRRLLLNAGLCHIDRGRFVEACRCLHDVRADEDEDPLILLVARGYLALVEHLGGNLERAGAEYKAVTRELVRMERPRAASIFFRHWGDLQRHRKEAAAWDTLQTALRLAETSGYEDIAHHARVSIVRAGLESTVSPATAIDALLQAEEYADVMDIPKLKCDALMVRAEILIMQNETSAAGEFATRALRIATLNGLVLRKIAFMKVLARVYDARGQSREAAALRARTSREARNVGYHLTVERLEKDSSLRLRTSRPVSAWDKPAAGD